MRLKLHLAALLLAATLATAARAEDIKLGIIAGLSGGGASYGASMRQGAEMAVKEINDAGGINGRRIVLDVADDASDPAQSVLAMQRLVNNRVDAVVGGWGSSQVLANMEVAERAGMPYVVVGASNPRITTARNKWTFRILTNDAGQATRLAEVAVRLLGMKRIAVISDSNDYGVGCRDIFLATLKGMGAAAVDVESYQTNDKDFTAQLTHIANANPDGIALFGTLPAAPAIMNQARDLGVDARFMGAAGLSNEAILTLAPEASQKMIATAYLFDTLDPEAKAWTERYVAMFKGAAQAPRPSQAVPTFRGIGIVADCFRQAGTEKDALRQCIKGWHGKLFGLPPVEARFDDTNQLQVAVVLETVEGKQFALLPGAN